VRQFASKLGSNSGAKCEMAAQYRHLSECKSRRRAKKAKTPLFEMNNLWDEMHAHPLGFALQDCHHFSLSRQSLVMAVHETGIKN
jgi:hypothetical protein